MIDGWESSEGRKPGCLLLPPGESPTRYCPAASDRITPIPENQWEDYLSEPGRVNLDDSVPVVLDQDGIGSCAAEASTGSIMLQRSFSGQEFIKLNPWGLYHFSSDGVDRGSNIDTNLRLCRDQGVPTMDDWPRSHGFRTRPSDEAMEGAKRFRIDEFYSIKNKRELVSASLQGFSIVYGRKGHAILALYIMSLLKMKYLNSWGDWGDRGRGIDAINDVNYGYGVYATRSVVHGDAPRVGLRPRISEMPPMPEFEQYPVINDEEQ